MDRHLYNIVLYNRHGRHATHPKALIYVQLESAPDWPKVRLIGPTWPDRLAQCLFVLLSQRVGIDPDQLALNLLAMSFERQILLFRICVTYNKSWHWSWDDVSCIRQASKARFGQSSALQRFQGWEQLRTSGARQDKEGSELEILEVLSVLHVLQA